MKAIQILGKNLTLISSSEVKNVYLMSGEAMHFNVSKTPGAKYKSMRFLENVYLSDAFKPLSS